MFNAGFQYLQQRGKTNLVEKVGVVSKDSPFVNGDNSGIYDVIAEDLRWLYDNRGSSSGSSGGSEGAPGASAYEIAVKNGFTGTEANWLASLVGAAGAKGDKGDTGAGIPGAKGGTGSPGASAYEIAVKNGFTGTEANWLASLVGAAGAKGDKGDTGPTGKAGAAGRDGAAGDKGANGKSAYEIAAENGYAYTEKEWLASLKGDPGTNGKDGKDGSDGKSATFRVGSVTFGDKFDIVNSGTESDVILNVIMPQNSSPSSGDGGGGTGSPGASAYEIAVKNGFTGTEANWLASLVGAAGKSAYDCAVQSGYVGTEAEWLKSLKGINGVAATVKVGSVTTGDTLSITNSGTEDAAVLNFVIPSASGSVDLSGCYTKTEIDAKIGNIESALKAIVG